MTKCLVPYACIQQQTPDYQFRLEVSNGIDLTTVSFTGVNEGDMYTQNAQGVTWKIRTLKSVIKMLGHENQVIDGLKFDVEGHEWQVVENFMDISAT